MKGEGYEDVKGFCKSATIDEIKEADYSLVPGRYVGIDDSGKMSEEEVKAEIVRVKQELKELMEKAENLTKNLCNTKQRRLTLGINYVALLVFCWKVKFKSSNTSCADIGLSTLTINVAIDVCCKTIRQ